MTRQAKQSSQGRANKYFDGGVVGRKTGLRVKPNVKKDVDGFDSIEDFWDSGGDENAGDTSQPSDREHQRKHLARRRSQEIYNPSSAISGRYSSSDLSTLPSPFLYRPSNYRRRTSAIPLQKSTTGSTSWDDFSIERARFNEDSSLLGVLAEYGRIKSQGNFSEPQRDFRSSDTSAATKSHMQSTNPSRDSRITPARQPRLSDMFARLHHTSSSPMHDYTHNPFRDSQFYLLDTPSRPSHSVVPYSMWTSRAVDRKRYDSLGVGVQGTREVSNYLESTVYPSNEEISEPPMFYFPDEDDVIAANSYGQLGIEYDEAAVAEMMAERRKVVAPESQYADVDYSMVSAAPEEFKVKAIGKTKSTTTRQAALAGNLLSKQIVTTATVRPNAKKPKKPNGEFEEPAPVTVQHERQVLIPPQKTVSEIQRAQAPPCDDASASNQQNVNQTVDTYDSCDADDEQDALAQSGFDEEARVEGNVVDPATGAAIVVRTIAESKQTMSRFKVIPESGYKHHSGLACGEISSGVMKIQPDCEKPNRRANAGTVIFYVTKGRVEVTINDCTFAVTTGGQFMVPRGNQYSIKNASRDDCTIFYARVKAHDVTPIPRADECKDERKGNTGRSKKEQTKPESKKLLQPPSPEPSPESSSLSSPEPMVVVTKKSRSKKAATS
ncbi:hypothetical protein CPC16_011485 [Podila verticillata]|nr:hypothetical protein CPC16_011485 [Podila verticillata]